MVSRDQCMAIGPSRNGRIVCRELGASVTSYIVMHRPHRYVQSSATGAQINISKSPEHRYKSLPQNDRKRRRNHQSEKKKEKPCNRVDRYKYFFSHHIIDTRNSLPAKPNDFSSLAWFTCFVRRTDLSHFLSLGY